MERSPPEGANAFLDGIIHVVDDEADLGGMKPWKAVLCHGI
jgi:hypothetical protein